MTPAGSPRLPYPELPAPLRADIEAALGSPVASVTDRPGGFSPGTAAVLTCADGTQAFVKAVGTPLNPDTPDLHRTEARVAAALPPDLPAPRLRWWTEQNVDGATWVALLFDAVDGEPPALPWTPAAAAQVVPVLADLARAGTPCPVPGLPPVADRLAGQLTAWGALAGRPPADLDPWERRHLDWLAAAIGRLTASGGLSGETLVHLDVRADNLLVTAEGAVVVVDWPWAARGAAWVDTVLFALDPAVHGGVDPELLVADSPVVAAADPADVTDLLVALTGTWAQEMRRRPPPGLPTVRDFQRRFHDAALAWARRRVDGGLARPL
ncbi:phosphotransferase family protein [Geodermatophilus sp. SYSU D01176]